MGEAVVTSSGHGSSEGHEMLKRYDIYHSIAYDVLIPKMYFLSKSVGDLFKNCTIDLCVHPSADCVVATWPFSAGQ